jgi:Dullard-like phosphatase family protein
VFTASEKAYADAIINSIDSRKAIRYRIYRNNCIQRDNRYIKDLRILNRDTKHCILIDNSIISFMSQLDNGMPIRSFVGNQDDYELLEILKNLSGMWDCNDVRKFLRQRYCLSQLYSKIIH